MHTTNKVLDFLKSKFNGRVISNRLDFSWPAKSPDLNQLDYYFYGAAVAEVNKKKPKTIFDLKKGVEDTMPIKLRGTHFIERLRISKRE